MKPAASRIAILVGAGLVSFGVVGIASASDAQADPTAAMVSARARLASIAPVMAVDRDDWGVARRDNALHTLSKGTGETAVLPAKVPAAWRRDRSVGPMMAQAEQFGGFPPLGYDPEQDRPQAAPPPPANPLPAAGGAAAPGGLSQFGAPPDWGAGATTWPGAGALPPAGMAGSVPMPGSGGDYSYGGPPAGMAGGADRWGPNVDYFSGQNFPSTGMGGAGAGYQGFTASGMQGYAQPGGLPAAPNYPPPAGQQGANPYWSGQSAHPGLPGAAAMPGVQPGYPGSAGVQPYGGLPGQGGAFPGLGAYPGAAQGLAPQGGLAGYPQQLPGLPGGYGAAPGYGYPYPPAYGMPGYPYGAPGGYGLPGQGYGADPYRPRPPYPQPQSFAPSGNPWGGSDGQTVPASSDPAVQPPSNWGHSATVAEQQVQPGRYSPYQAPQEAAPKPPAVPGWSGRAHGSEGSFPPIEGFHWERQMVPGQVQPSGRGPVNPVANTAAADGLYPPLDNSLPGVAADPRHWNTVSTGSDWAIR